MDNDAIPLFVFLAFMLLLVAVLIGGLIYMEHQNNVVRLKAIEAMERLATPQTAGDEE